MSSWEKRMSDKHSKPVPDPGPKPDEECCTEWRPEFGRWVGFITCDFWHCPHDECHGPEDERMVYA